MLKPGTYLQNRYEILEKIGSGGMSVVYKAQCHTLNRLVAIKVLKEEFATDSSFVSKFKMEAQSAAGLSHPNIVSIYDVVDEDDLHYIVMELIEGITLKSYIEKKGVLENKEAIGIAIQVASGIAAAHEQHIIHRDIKPQNMIISRDGSVKVADFGIARAVSTQTLNATAVGSVHYISPEQARGIYCDERSDIYSFGITMYEMVTGRVPFEGDNTVAIALAHLEDPVVPPGEYNPKISLGLEEIILKCTQKKPERRYANVTDVISDLRKVLLEPSYDIYEDVRGSQDEMGDTRTISKDELGIIKQAYESKNGDGSDTEPEAVTEDPQSAKTRHRRSTGPVSQKGRRPHPPSRKQKEEETDVRSQFERIITGIGVVAAILVVAVVLFLFSQLSGLFRRGTSQPTQESVTVTATASPELEVTTSDNQVKMPYLLGLPEDMAEQKLKESSLVMHVSERAYSENYKEGQVMAQTVSEGTSVDKWSQVDVTISKGSDKVDLEALSLNGMKEADAKALLTGKELTVQIQTEHSDTVEKGLVTRYVPSEAKAGDTVTLYISSGARIVEGQVPNLLNTDPVTADALLAGAGLTTGSVTYELSETVPEGLIISQSVLPDTILAPLTPVDYVVSGQAQETASQTGETEEEKYYVSSLDVTCSLSDYIGPASQTSSVRVMVRLKQHVNGVDIYTPLIKERLVAGSQDIPIVLQRIKGAYGVDTGTVEVVDAGSENLKVIASYPLTFFPAG